MKKNVLSFAVGAALKNGQFAALLLKFRFTDHSEQLTAWPKPQLAKLFHALSEYYAYLQYTDTTENADDIENVIRTHTPTISQDEASNPPVSAVVTAITAHVRKTGDMELTLHLGKPEEKFESILVITPHHREWLQGYIGNTLNEFDENGFLFQPEGMAN